MQISYRAIRLEDEMMIRLEDEITIRLEDDRDGQASRLGVELVRG